MTTLEDLITRANNALGALENLIAGDASTTPVPDDSVSYTVLMPTYDELTDEWTLTQDSADTDGLYKGAYNLALESGCSIVTLVSHDVVTPDDGVPVRYRACDATEWTDLSTMTAVDGEEIKSLEFRSKNPFSITIKLTAVWRQTFDFTASNGGFTQLVSDPTRAQYVSGQGWKANTWQSGSTRQRLCQIVRSISVTTITSVLLKYDRTNGNANGNGDGDAINLRFNSVYTKIIGPTNSGVTQTGIELSWTGELQADEIYIDFRPSGAINGTATGDCRVYELQVCGTGENPFSS